MRDERRGPKGGGLNKRGVLAGVAMEMVASKPLCTPQMGGHTPMGEGPRGREKEGKGTKQTRKKQSFAVIP